MIKVTELEAEMQSKLPADGLTFRSKLERAAHAEEARRAREELHRELSIILAEIEDKWFDAEDGEYSRSLETLDMFLLELDALQCQILGKES